MCSILSKLPKRYKIYKILFFTRSIKMFYRDNTYPNEAINKPNTGDTDKIKCSFV